LCDLFIYSIHKLNTVLKYTGHLIMKNEGYVVT